MTVSVEVQRAWDNFGRAFAVNIYDGERLLGSVDNGETITLTVRRVAMLRFSQKASTYSTYFDVAANLPRSSGSGEKKPLVGRVERLQLDLELKMDGVQILNRRTGAVARNQDACCNLL